MRKWIPMAVTGLVLLAGGAWWWTTLPTGPPCGPCPVGLQEPPPGSEAVLGIASGRGPGEAAVMRAGGRVDFVDLSDGRILDRLETGAKAWATRYPHAGEMPVGYEFRHEEHTLLAGLPAASSGGRTVAVAGSDLLQWEGGKTPVVLARDPAFADARLAAHNGPGSPVYLALADRRVARVDVDGGVVFSAPLPARLTCITAAGDGVLAGGESTSWFLLRGEDLGRGRSVPLRGRTAPVLAIDVSDDGKRAAVSHGMCLPNLDAYALDGVFGPVLERTFGAKGPGGISLALDPREGLLYFGKSCGGNGYCDESGYHGFPLGGNPQHGLALLQEGTLLVHGWDDGTLYAERVPSEEGVWGDRPTRREAAAAPSGTRATDAPR